MSKPRPGKDARSRTAHRFGLRAETLAAAWLTLKGYRILARRFKASGGEIDIIVWRRGVVAFVEVKARPSLDEALSSIALHKRQRISRAARAWLSRNPWAAARTLRGDAVYVAPWRWPKHVVAAVELEM